MDANALRAMQAPYKDKYKSDPNAAVITLKAHSVPGVVDARIQQARTAPVR